MLNELSHAGEQPVVMLPVPNLVQPSRLHRRDFLGQPQRVQFGESPVGDVEEELRGLLDFTLHRLLLLHFLRFGGFFFRRSGCLKIKYDIFKY